MDMSTGETQMATKKQTAEQMLAQAIREMDTLMAANVRELGALRMAYDEPTTYAARLAKAARR